ncbi:unnamed protein product [Prunus armeniaca]
MASRAPPLPPRVKWHAVARNGMGCQALSSPPPTWCHTQACRAAGSDRLRGPLNRKEVKNNPDTIVSFRQCVGLFVPFRRLVSWRRAPRGDAMHMAEPTEEELERRACNCKTDKSQIWAPTS